MGLLADLERTRDCVVALSRNAEPGLLELADASRARAIATELKNAAASIEARLAKRVVDAGAWKRAGDRSPAEHIAKQLGVSITRAEETIKAADLASCPHTAEAVASGAISIEQAAAIAVGASANPAAERQLLRAAESGSMRHLKDEAARVKAAADRDPRATYERNRAERKLTRTTGADGVIWLFGQTVADQGARIWRAIEERLEERFQHARLADTKEPREAYAIDALDDICSQWLEMRRGGAVDDGVTVKKRRDLRYRGIVRVDAAALRRGRVEDDEVCEIKGVGPVPVATARELLGDALLHLVITDGVDVKNVVNLKRGATEAQRVALLWGNLHCDIGGCTDPFTDIDHLDPWSDTHHTVLDELRTPCKFHHRLKTLGWAVVVDEHGRKTMVPPDDPQAPRAARPPP